MPKLNQNPAPGQPFALPKDRQISTIPKAKPDEEGQFWVYPSQQVLNELMTHFKYVHLIKLYSLGFPQEFFNTKI